MSRGSCTAKYVIRYFEKARGRLRLLTRTGLRLPNLDIDSLHRICASLMSITSLRSGQYSTELDTVSLTLAQIPG